MNSQTKQIYRCRGFKAQHSPTTGTIDLKSRFVDWEAQDSQLRFNQEFERRLLYTAGVVCDELGIYSFDQMEWIDDTPYLTAIYVEKLDDHTAKFRTAGSVEFTPESLFGFVPTKAFEQSSDVFLLSDANPSLSPGPRVIYVNDAFEAMTGYGRSEIVGKTPRILHGENTCPKTRGEIREALSTWSAVDVVMVNYKKDQSEFLVNLEIVPIADKIGWYVYWFAVQRNITEERKEKKCREQLVQKAVLAEDATEVLHNVGNVLNSINLSTVIIERNRLESKPLRALHGVQEFLLNNEDEILKNCDAANKFKHGLSLVGELFESDSQELSVEAESIRENVEHIKQIVVNQQANARSRSSEMVEVITVNELLEQAMNICKGHMNHSIEVLVSPTEEEVTVKINKHKALQIISNLVKNSIEATAESTNPHPTVKVTANCSERHIGIKVSDNGCGFEMSKLEQLFSHGFTTKYYGSGFGLHACITMATELGGSLVGYSDGPGKGAKFELHVPYGDLEKGCARVPVCESEELRLAAINEGKVPPASCNV